jgi:hypothetical protein
MAGLKKNMLISISTALLGVVVLFALDNQILKALQILLSAACLCAPDRFLKSSQAPITCPTQLQGWS